ncbi:hypothetical protein GYA37_03370 [candidate division WWE3 bacterium]|uniref:Uncharacterized protein n=1 Tax=candidate division WWE3 bacterium TaxID=2053526 RepID=A0A7X9E7C4_UNCKA|nr:hypothetical protein [candidate division WWE3 bacterium]
MHSHKPNKGEKMIVVDIYDSKEGDLLVANSSVCLKGKHGCNILVPKGTFLEVVRDKSNGNVKISFFRDEKLCLIPLASKSEDLNEFSLVVRSGVVQDLKMLPSFGSLHLLMVTLSVKHVLITGNDIVVKSLGPQGDHMILEIQNGDYRGGIINVRYNDFFKCFKALN